MHDPDIREVLYGVRREWQEIQMRILRLVEEKGWVGADADSVPDTAPEKGTL